jgi:hypothetical protein
MTERRADYKATVNGEQSKYTGGWRVRRHYFDGRPSVIEPITASGRNLPWCRRLVRNLYGESDPGDCEYSIAPLVGWEAVDADPLAAVVYHVAAGDVSPDAALAEIRALTQASDGNPAPGAGQAGRRG